LVKHFKLEKEDRSQGLPLKRDDIATENVARSDRIDDNSASIILGAP
jgi:hypothetical protein